MIKFVVVGTSAVSTKEKADEGKHNSPLLLVELAGSKLPPEYQVLPARPPMEVNLKDLEKAVERCRKAATEAGEAADDARRQTRKLHGQVAGSKDFKETTT